MRKKLWKIILVPLLFLVISLWAISSPTVGRLDVSSDKDLIDLKVNFIEKSLSRIAKVECKKVRKGCEHIVSRLGKGGFTGKEYSSWTDFEKECLATGCLEWGMSEREFVSLNLTSEEVTTIVNEFKSPKLPLSEIKVKFEDGKILASGASSFPFAIGNTNGEGEIVRDNYVKINKLYLGRVPILQRRITSFEEDGNRYLQNTFAQYNIIVEMMEVEGDKLVFNAYVPKGSVKRVNGKLVLNLQKTRRDELRIQKDEYRIR